MIERHTNPRQRPDFDPEWDDPTEPLKELFGRLWSRLATGMGEAEVAELFERTRAATGLPVLEAVQIGEHGVDLSGLSAWAPKQVFAGALAWVEALMQAVGPERAELLASDNSALLDYCTAAAG